MNESGYYPAGAEFDPSAPYNLKPVPELEFTMTVSQTLSKSCKVTTDDYVPVVEYEPHNRIHEEYPDTSDTAWRNVYADNGYHTPVQLIEILKEVLQLNLDNGLVYKSPAATHALIAECSDWCNDETEYIEN